MLKVKKVKVTKQGKDHWLMYFNLPEGIEDHVFTGIQDKEFPTSVTIIVPEEFSFGWRLSKRNIKTNTFNLPKEYLKTDLKFWHFDEGEFEYVK